ncbi:3-hydroxybutyryl-CoA dehydrogenase [Clostridiales Family XIII bacterium PM5-7]
MIKTIAVLGAGTMGHGIAEYFAMSGYPVNLYEPYEPMRRTCMDTIKEELVFLGENQLIKPEEVEPILGRITVFADLEEAVKDIDYVIEATREDVVLKQELFQQLEQYTKPEAILASNTSSLALNKMIEKLSDEKKAKCMVCHWYNPAHLMPLVELSFFGNMDEETFRTVEELYEQAGKQTCRVLKDVPGLVANRIQQGVAREAFSLIQEGIASPKDIDKALKFGPAFRYATTGQLEVADMGGLDIWCTVGDNLLSVMDNRTDSNPILRKKVEEGKLGMKSGEGFFTYPEDQIQEKKNAFNRRLIVQLKASKHYSE